MGNEVTLTIEHPLIREINWHIFELFCVCDGCPCIKSAWEVLLSLFKVSLLKDLHDGCDWMEVEWRLRVKIQVGATVMEWRFLERVEEDMTIWKRGKETRLKKGSEGERRGAELGNGREEGLALEVDRERAKEGLLNFVLFDRRVCLF